MHMITVDELQTKLNEIADRAEQGETFVVMRGNVRLGLFGPYVQKPLPSSYRLGLLKGRAKIPELWKELSRTEIEEEFYGR